MNIENSNQKLSSKERSLLRSNAHNLKPVVMIGDNGLTETVIKEIDQNLNSHGLIKIKISGDDKEYRLNIATEINQKLGSELVSHLGKIITLYRPNEEYKSLLKKSRPRQASERLPNEEYTPKKLAAVGKKSLTTVSKGGKAKSKPASTAGKPAPKSAKSKSAKPNTSSLKPSIPRKRGSSLTLRAGRRSRV
ncbi:ribosome assembly RNA-binding protein YhbY [Taylorella equigenitalis]|nr:ribosome assembly RNA-binding protein YhbY [Taylorella equigenitalis]ASY41142.1 ribosome assembly protein YhbY [Taylorella equigenitalis]WEE00071.1 ribosome assembly RNA-binding protein YhbY [Taylorella equigenitalis]WEE01548.1 ribosome assembly RNA-binding protein YhbY [Taylorella equigenitalis]WFD78085.1 ribosome assembly RNA-binding protein YhbY [Taylorella equigenitalis]WFD79563.1 ribosome assembly RNA-binding protein YhbY [Taylorella equigenitalis]